MDKIIKFSNLESHCGIDLDINSSVKKMFVCFNQYKLGLNASDLKKIQKSIVHILCSSLMFECQLQ